MNRIKFLGIIVLVFVMFGCEKEKLTVNEQENSESTYSLPESITENVAVVNGVLSFSSQEVVTKVINELENEQAKLNDVFYEKWKHLSEDELDAKAEELNFNSELVYEAFEKHFSLNSLRKKIAEQEEKWLNNEELDFSKYPGNHYVDGEGIRTIMTENCVAMIGKSVYIIKENWKTFEVKDANSETVSKIVSNDFFDLKNVKIHNEVNKKGLWKTNHSNWEEYVSGKRKMWYRVTITNGPFGYFFKATTRSFKKKRRRWKTRRTSIDAAAGGIVWKNSNGQEQDYTDTYNKKGWNWKVKAKENFPFVIKTKSGKISSVHSVNGVGTRYLTLSW